ncbi:MAG: DUF4162 domain-containing protein, partial [Actinobacteria bacterium]|nr:DUF4162 domain-containing protein [Actinomycetota bacterium]
LDPRSRSDLWSAIRTLARQGTAVVLTTQYLDEADQLADYVLLIDQRRVVAEGTPSELKRDVEHNVLDVQLTPGQNPAPAMEILSRAGNPVSANSSDPLALHVAVDSDAELALGLLRELHDNEIAVSDFQLRRPTLDDVFLTLTSAPSSGRST